MSSSTVLLIDSDQDSLTIYSVILRHHGYEVVPARDVTTALQLAASRNPDIVISELFIPFGKGQDVLQGLRASDRVAGKPLILLDSIPMLGEKLMDGVTGMSRLTKPCTPSRLVEEVGKLLKVSEA